MRVLLFTISLCFFNACGTSGGGRTTGADEGDADKNSGEETDDDEVTLLAIGEWEGPCEVDGTTSNKSAVTVTENLLVEIFSVYSDEECTEGAYFYTYELGFSALTDEAFTYNGETETLITIDDDITTASLNTIVAGELCERDSYSAGETYDVTDSTCGEAPLDEGDDQSLEVDETSLEFEDNGYIFTRQ